MDKKEKINQLLQRLDTLQKESESFVSSDLYNLTDEAIDEEMSGVSKEVRNSVTIKYLTALNDKLDKFKKDFNLAPISEMVESFKSEILALQTSIENENKEKSKEFENRIKELRTEIQSLSLSDDIKDLPKRLSDLNIEITKQKENEVIKDKKLSDILMSFTKRLDEIPNNLNTTKNENTQIIENTKVVITADIELKIKELRKEILTRFNEASGNMNRRIQVEGANVLTKYTDINIYGTTSSVLATVDNTNKRVNIGIQGGGGDISGSGNTNQVAYWGAPSVLTGNDNLTFNSSILTLTADSLGTSQVSTKGIKLTNNTAATALAPTQITPPIIFKSYAWRTDTSVSQYGEIRMYSKPITGAGAIPPRLIIEGSRNGAAFADMLRIWDNGNLEIIQAINVNGGVGTDGQVLISKAGAANQWSSTIPWSFVSASAPTTLSGYGITDALVSSQGAYTPTLTNINNVASSTMRPTQWVKVGNTVHLYGTFEITPTSAATKTEFTITIPVASTNGFANIYEAGGTANALHPDDENAGVPMPVTIWADNGTWTNTQSIYMKYSAVSTTNAVFSFHLSYTILPSAE